MPTVSALSLKRPLQWLFLALALAVSCAPKSSVEPASHDPPWRPPPFVDQARLVLVGDTGYSGPYADQLRTALLAEPNKDAIIVLGDLVYPFTPSCPDGKVSGNVEAFIHARVGAVFNGLGVPVLLVLGNHDVKQGSRAPAREACLLDYAAKHDDLVLPGLAYEVDLGVATLAVANTNALDEAGAARVSAAWKGHPGWKLLMGHHTWVTYHDKEDQDRVRPWARAGGLVPDLYANGHAHVLQFGVYDGVAALTSGSGSKLRMYPSCPPDCGAGQLWGASEYGYAVLTVTKRELVVVFKNLEGKELWRWSRQR